jgi:alkylation response protein AidB-like acyl-CoA dehydrogenase
MKGITEQKSHTKLALLHGHLAPQHLTKLKPIDDCWASVNGDAFLNERAIGLRKKTRAFMSSIEDKLIHYTNTTEFPFELMDGFRQLGVNGFMLKDFGGPGLTNVETGAIVYEMAKVDGSLYTFLGLHNFLGIATIDKCGNEEQR